MDGKKTSRSWLGLLFVSLLMVPLAISGAGAQTETHVIRYGDTLWGIARQHGTTVSAIVRANGLRDANNVPIGTRLVIPGSKASGSGRAAKASAKPVGRGGGRSGVTVCPVRGAVRGFSFLSSFGAPRSGHSHAGNDIFAAYGTQIRAVADGRVDLGSSRIGGHFVRLYGGSTKYYYAHLSGFAVSDGAWVRAGQVIGYVGKSGNAATTAPHLHFEIRPGSGAAIDPYPALSAVCRGR